MSLMGAQALTHPLHFFAHSDVPPAVAPVLDKEFRLTFSLTYNTFGGEAQGVNTEPFRTAVWYYVQRLYGVRNDHYAYEMVNRYLVSTAPAPPVCFSCA